METAVRNATFAAAAGTPYAAEAAAETYRAGVTLPMRPWPQRPPSALPSR